MWRGGVPKYSTIDPLPTAVEVPPIHESKPRRYEICMIGNYGRSVLKSMNKFDVKDDSST